MWRNVEMTRGYIDRDRVLWWVTRFVIVKNISTKNATTELLRDKVHLIDYKSSILILVGHSYYLIN